MLNNENCMLLGISAKKQGGKTTSTNYILGSYMYGLGIVRKGFAINKKGDLWVSDLNGNEAYQGFFDITRDTPALKSFLKEYVDPLVKVYPLADPLKNIATDLLDIPRNNIHGTNEEKDAIIHCLLNGEPSTGRKTMQWLGENLRKMYPDVYISYALKRINASLPLLAIINDVRYPNEVDRILEAGGKVVRLTRAPFHGQDLHESETSLDPENFDWSKFSAILDNSKLNISKTNEKLAEILRGWGYLPDFDTKVEAAE